jgi:hypothetical protein
LVTTHDVLSGFLPAISSPPRISCRARWISGATEPLHPSHRSVFHHFRCRPLMNGTVGRQEAGRACKLRSIPEGLFSSARYIPRDLFTPNHAENVSKIDMVSKCSRDAAQSWEGPKVMIAARSLVTKSNLDRLPRFPRIKCGRHHSIFTSGVNRGMIRTGRTGNAVHAHGSLIEQPLRPRKLRPNALCCRFRVASNAERLHTGPSAPMLSEPRPG